MVQFPDPGCVKMLIISKENGIIGTPGCAVLGSQKVHEQPLKKSMSDRSKSHRVAAQKVHEQPLKKSSCDPPRSPFVTPQKVHFWVLDMVHWGSVGWFMLGAHLWVLKMVHWGSM